ncbi:MAG: retron Eco8 family effector endonuclease [Ruminococcus sp.]|nr:retron Eco8 family effector endonuclease [Ruminococcus sp.]
MIKKISIQNFKSIENSKFVFNNDSKQIICLIGKNGSGKSNIFKAISYFFKYINKTYSEEKIIDNSNPYIQKCIISITFDIDLLSKKADKNEVLRKKFEDIKRYKFKYTNFTLAFDSEIELKLIQYRDGTIKWNINDKSICNTIKNVFPIYYIDTRHLDIYTWDKLWKIISDLSSAIPQITQEESEILLDETFKKIYGEKYIHSKEKVEGDFKKYGITLDKYNFDSKYKMTFSMRFGGEHFLIDGHSLDYYSDGTSSFNYLKLLISLIPKISELSCKYPIVLIDEPEIGLHNALITEFVDCLCDSINKNALSIISTHSSKLIADLSHRSFNNYSLYKVYKKGFSSVVNKMNTKWIDDSKHKVTIRETECYFSDNIVYVEGETEVQLFSHPKILELFDKLRKVHFYSFDSNDSRLRSVHSGIINLGIPYKIIVDMDKIIDYYNNMFCIKKELLVNPLSNYDEKKFEQYRFYSHKQSDIDLISIRNDIFKLKKKQFSLKNNKNYIEDNDYNHLIDLIIKFSNYYNVIVNWSTIEGALITYENIDEFIKFTKTRPIKFEKQHSIICNETDVKEKTVLMLGVYNGKSETFKKIKLNKKDISIEANKTSGWVREWISYFFENKIDVLSTPNEKRVEFKKFFPQLFSTLQIIESMV